MMWEVNSGAQVLVTALAFGLGACICLAYDVLRAIRDYKRIRRFGLFVFDLLTFVFCAIIIFCFLQLYSNGRPRFYILCGVGAGFVFCRLTVSYYVVKAIKLIARKAEIGILFFGRALNKIICFFEKIPLTVIKIIKNLLKPLKIKQKTLEKQ